eukprot:gene4492-14648_t
MARSNSPKRRRDDKRYRQKAGTEGAPPQDATKGPKERRSAGQELELADGPRLPKFNTSAHAAPWSPGQAGVRRNGGQHVKSWLMVPCCQNQRMLHLGHLVSKTSSIQAQQLAQLEEEVLRNVEEAVTKMVEKEMASEDVQRRIQVRLKEERARLEEQVSIQLDTERAALLEKKRKEQVGQAN